MNYMQGDGRGLGGGPPPPRPTSGYIQHQHLQGHQHHQQPHLGGMQGPHHGQQQHPALQQQHHAYQQQQAQHQPQPPAQHHPPLPSTASSMSHHHGMGSNGGMGNNLMGSNGGLGIGSSLDDDQLFKQFLKQDTGVVDLEYDGDDAFQKMEEELMNNDYLFDAPIMQMPPAGADALSNPPSAPLSSGRSNGQQQTGSGTYHNQGEMYPPASRNKGFDASNSTSTGPSSAWGTASNETSTTSTTATSSTSPSTSTSTTSTSPSSTSTTTTGSPPSSSQQQPAGQGAGGSRFQRNGPAKSEDDQQDQDFSMGMAQGSDGAGPQGSKQQPGPSGATNASASAGGSVPSSGPPSGNAPQLGSSASMGQPAAGQQQQQQPPAQGAGGGVQSQLQQQQQIHLQQQQQLHQQQIQQQQQLQQHQQQQQQQQHPRDLQQLQQHHQQQQQQLQQQHQQQQQQLHQHQFQQHQQQLHHMQQQQQRHQAAAAAAGRSAATAPSPPSISSTPSSGPTPPAPAQPTPPAQSTSMGPGGPGVGGMMLPGQQMGKWKGAHHQAPPTAGPGSNGAPVGGIPSSGPASGPIGGLPPQPQQQPGPPGGGLIRSTSYDAVAGQMKMGGGAMDPRMVGAQGQVHPGMQRNPYHAYGAYGPPQGQQHGAPPHLQQQSQPPQPSGFAPHMQPPPGMTHGAVSGQPPNAYFAMQRNPTRTMSSPHMSLGGPGQPPQPTGYGGQFHPGQAAQPGGPMYEGGPHPSSGYPSSAYYGRSGGGEPVVARNGEGGAAPVFSPQTQFQMQVRSQHMRRLNQALGQQVTPGGPVAGGPTGPAPSPGGQSGPAMVTTPGGPLAASSMPSPAGPGQVGADAVGQQQLSHVTTPGGTQSAGGGVPSSATTVSGPVGGLPSQASAPGGVGHPGMGGYPGHPGMMAKRPPGGMGMIGGPQHPGGPQTALVSGQGQQQPGGQGQPDNVGPGAMVGVPGGPGGPGVMPPNVSVPRSDLALSQFKEVWENLGMYRNFLFQLVPINPSALLEANVKYILATPEGAAIRTPLSLSVYVVMALGSLLRANFRMTREFANKAHEHLVHTLEQRQSIDYTLGQALLGMAYIEAAMETVPSSSKWKQFYAELAMKICKRLGAYSSILYFHSMFFISCDPTISLERLIQMQREGNQTPDLPYHTFIEPNSDGIRQAMPVSVLSHGRGNAAGRVLINVINGLNIHMKSSQLEHSQHAAAQQPGGGGPPPPYGPPMGAPPPHHGAPPPLSPAPGGGSGAAATIPTSPAPTGPSPSPLTKPMSPASHFGSWTAGPTAMSMPVGSTGPVMPASAAAMGGPGPGGVVPGGVVVGITGQTPQPPTMPPYFDSTSYFYQLMESMDKLEKELRVIQTTADPLPTYAYFTFCLCIYSLHAACCWRMGMKDKALFWAKKFLSDSHKEEWRSCCGGPPMQEMIGLVLNIFLQMNELESLDFQLNQIERLLVVYPALNAMVTHFQKVLWEKKEQQLIMQKRRQMYIQQQQQQGGMPGPMSPHHPLASPPPPMAMGMGMPMHPSAGVVVPHGPMPHHMGGHHLPGQGQPLPSHVPQMSPHQPQMSPQQQQQQQQMAAQMTPPQPQAQEGASTGEMSPPGAKGKGGRGGRASRGRVGASAAAATKSRSGSSSSGVGTPGQTSTSGDGTPSNQTPNQPSPISTTTPTAVVPQPSPSGCGAPARGRAAKQQQQQGARGAGGGKPTTRSKKRERDERDETENGGGGGGGGVNGERGGIKLEEQTEERERKREREDNDSNLMRETATSSAPDSLQLAINSSSQASQDDDGSTSAGAGIKSEQSVKLERMDEQQLNGNGSMNNAGGLLGAMMGLDNGGMGLGMGSMGDVAGFGGGGPLMPPFSNGSFDAASLSLSLEDPFLEPELESGWWENL